MPTLADICALQSVPMTAYTLETATADLRLLNQKDGTAVLQQKFIVHARDVDNGSLSISEEWRELPVVEES